MAIIRPTQAKHMKKGNGKARPSPAPGKPGNKGRTVFQSGGAPRAPMRAPLHNKQGGGRANFQVAPVAKKSDKGKGKGGGSWVFVPAGAPLVLSQGGGFKQGQQGQSKGKGKGQGKGKAMTPEQEKKRKMMDKLGKIDAEKKVWVGGLPKDVTRGKLIHHFKETARVNLVEIMSKGTACISFKSEDDASAVIGALNGSEIDGKSIEVDVWTQKEKKEKKEGDEKRKRPKKKKLGVSTQVLKAKGKLGKKPEVNSKLKEKLRAVDHTLKLWVGGLSKDTTWKELKTHFTEAGCEVDMADLMKPGTAQVTFKTEDEATSALGLVNGTELKGKTIEVDVWTKPVRKEKKNKGVKEEAEE